MIALPTLLTHLFIGSAIFGQYSQRTHLSYESYSYFKGAPYQYVYDENNAIIEGSQDLVIYGCDEFDAPGNEGLYNVTGYNITFDLLIPNLTWIEQNWHLDSSHPLTTILDFKYLENDYFTLNGSNVKTDYLKPSGFTSSMYTQYIDNNENDTSFFKIILDTDEEEYKISYNPTILQDNSSRYFYVAVEAYSLMYAMVNVNDSTRTQWYCNNPNYNYDVTSFSCDASEPWRIRFKLFYSNYIDQFGYDSLNAFEGGYQQGFEDGYIQGTQVALEGSSNLFTLFGYIVDTPILYLRKLFDYEILGINLFGFMCGIISLALVLWVVRRLI